MARPLSLTRIQTMLRDHALTYPETKEDFPWGHCAIKVKGKIFLSLSLHENVLSLSVKLPISHQEALALPFATPTRYGLGKTGWVTAQFEAKAEVPTELLREWVDESFRAIAPKKVLAQLESAETPAEKPKRKARRKKGD